MEKTIINIQNEANVYADGEHNNGNCDPCIILETGETFTSQIDLAKRLEVSACAVSSVICGRQRTLKGFHVVSMSRLTEGADLVLSRLREASAMEDDAQKWRAYQAEQEAIRKAKEEREAAIEKAKNKVAYRHKICSRLEEQYNKAMARAMEAEKEYEELTGEAYIQESEEKEMKSNDIQDPTHPWAC